MSKFSFDPEQRSPKQTLELRLRTLKRFWLWKAPLRRSLFKTIYGRGHTASETRAPLRAAPHLSRLLLLSGSFSNRSHPFPSEG